MHASQPKVPQKLGTDPEHVGFQTFRPGAACMSKKTENIDVTKSFYGSGYCCGGKKLAPHVERTNRSQVEVGPVYISVSN